ncbi:MAG: DUF1015 domain-containing protein [Actinobacteria bacterium]|nr:DUF1015 domain-containing protein [Actinomycetota bacterium]
MSRPGDQPTRQGLSLQPFRGLRPVADGESLARLLCPPYDVIDARARDILLERDPENAVAVVLPEPTPAGYAEAAQRIDRWVSDGRYITEPEPALYVYEMRDIAGNVTRGLLGAVELRPAADGVILPHENTMAGPVADRLALMTATGTDLEPIYLVYDGGGTASELVRGIDSRPPAATATTPDGITHRLWLVTDRVDLDAVATDLATRRAMIADGHHRYATYQERQRQQRESAGAGPWDRGLALVVDASDYGPQVHAIHRVVSGLTLTDAVNDLTPVAAVEEFHGSPAEALDSLPRGGAFAAVLTDGRRTWLVMDRDARLAAAAGRPGQLPELTDLDVTVLHRALVEEIWRRTDDEATVGYAHGVADALQDAQARGGVAVLLRPTPVAAVTAVAAAGGRMPRKSTLFTPKPASGLVMRRLADQG